MGWNWIFILIAVIYVFVGFVIAHKDLPSFARYTWLDYKILAICVIAWPFILVHDWWINRNF